MLAFANRLTVFTYALIVSICCIAGVAHPSRAQWLSQLSATTANLRSVALVDAMDAGVSGDNATALWTADGGLTWLPMVTGFPGNYLGMGIGDEFGNSLYYVGDMQGVVYTIDGGITWAEGTVPTKTTINSVSFLLADSIGIAVGNSGTILRTTDYGATWKQINAPTTSDLFDVIMYGNEVDAVGANGTWTISTDYGLTWQAYTLPTSSTIYSFDFDDLSETGWMVGDHVILKTTDYGNSWTQTTFSNPSILRSVSLTDSLTAFVCGDNGRILETTDRTNWIDLTTNTTQNISSLQMYGTDSGWAAGASGVILAWQQDASAVNASSGTSLLQFEQNFPNPFSGSTTMRYQLPENAHVSLIIYNELGEVAETLADAEQSSGIHNLTWNAQNFPAGIYFCKLSVGNSTTVQRLLLTK